MSSDQEERQRLVELYTGMSDEELASVWRDYGGLTDLAQQLLQAELARRGLALAPAESGNGDAPEWDELVVVKQFRDLHEALLAKGSLESAGIECFLVDDNMLRLDWFVSNLLGGAKLCVRPEVAEAALDLLEQPVPASFEVEVVGTYDQPTCPQCHSLDVTYEALDKGASYASTWLLSIPLRGPRKRWKCNQCGNTWRESAVEV